ncbi:MAG: hypothetical protein Q9191_001792 [Dirinaria sp. TL-2023a]
MAPTSRTPRRAAREGDYQAIGVKGRRTGATLKDTGIRDEHGLEPVPSFSSPEKSAPNVNGTNGAHSSYTEDVTMEIGESTIAEPTERLRPSRTSNIKFPLPQARSPLKTHTGSSPRRSLGPMSPSKRYEPDTPSRAFSHPPPSSLAKRKHNESVNEPTPQGGRASTLKRPKKTPPSARIMSSTVNMNIEDEPEPDQTMALTNGDVTMNDDTTANGYANEDTPLPGIEDDSLTMPQNDAEALEGTMAGAGADEDEPEPSGTLENAATVPKPKRGRGRPSVNENFESSQISLSAARPRGRPRVHRDSSVRPAETPKGKGRGKRTALKPTPANRGPNAKIKALTTPTKKRSTSRSGSVRPSSRNNLILRSETPAEGSGALVTRSGRHSIKPLAGWRGERAVLAPTTIDEVGTTLGGFQSVVRTDEILEPKKLEDVEEEEEEMEDWERDTGVMTGTVMGWDGVEGSYNQDEVETIELAYSARAIQMREVAGQTGQGFLFAKTLTLPFFGSGMVDLPPGGSKRSKNSRKMHMVFFVFYGRILVEMGTPPTRFGIGKGGMWQVPRGNWYGIANPSKTTARIFFAQGCAVPAESSGLEDGVSA